MTLICIVLIKSGMFHNMPTAGRSVPGGSDENTYCIKVGDTTDQSSGHSENSIYKTMMATFSGHVLEAASAGNVFTTPRKFVLFVRLKHQQ